MPIYLSGFLIGLLFAIIFRKHGPQPTKYYWEDESLDDEDYFLIENEHLEEEWFVYVCRQFI